MTNAQELKRSIEIALKGWATQPLEQAAISLLDVLGYRSSKKLLLRPNTADNFLQTFAKNRPLTFDHALASDWRSVDFLFQLTDDEVRAVALGEQSLLFESKAEYQGAIVESYVFLAIELKPRRYTRTELSGVVRAVNRLFSMPVFVLFRHGDTATLAIIRRRLHKRDESKDVLEKVTLIKDIVFADPIRAHIEILYDLALPVLFEEYRFHNFVGLHQAWEKRLASFALNERFYREIAAWYFWALSHKHVTLPRSIENIRDKDEHEKQQSIFFIRLLTRLIFCWFLQEKNLIPRDLFRPRVAEGLLKDWSPKAGTYYRAFLQNLFFATLNQEQEKRGWRKEYEKSTRKGNRGATNLWRYRDLLHNPAQLETLLRDHIPFVNGGLFDCLDQVFQEKEGRDDIRLDDFSEERSNGLCLPNELFFGSERDLDLSGVYDDQRRKREKVRGLIETLSRYKFTVEENTPLEEEIALDPELLGKVFENLLASYNEDTRTTARKALGGFYTPREIVTYMVDEALIAFLSRSVSKGRSEENGARPHFEARLRYLLTVEVAAFTNPFTPGETSELITAIGNIKILDPACGSGAFPMGALHRLVDLLQKLDPNNEKWKMDRLAEAERYCDLLRQSETSPEELSQCEARIEDISKSFDTHYHALDFARKLYIIENSIFGVDIQPIATQIAKLRFFIALIVDQKISPGAPNLGVRPLPNLETKIVAADALTPLKRPQIDLLAAMVRPLRLKLDRVRHDHFNARTPSAKTRCRQRDAEIRGELTSLLANNGLHDQAATDLASWNPYDQNHAAPFFDSEWMFGLATPNDSADGSASESDSGFDVIVGNPPYVRQEQIKELKSRFKKIYSVYSGTADLYVYFYEASVKLLHAGGVLSFVTSNKWLRAAYSKKLRKWLTENTRILQLIDFGDAPVFKAISYPCIVLMQRRALDDSTPSRCRALTWEKGSDLEVCAQIFQSTSLEIAQDQLEPNGWKFDTSGTSELRRQMKSRSIPLGKFSGELIFNGVKSGHKEAFTLNSQQRERLVIEESAAADLTLPLLVGRDIKRWRIENSSRWLLYIPWHFPLQDKKNVDAASRLAETAFKKRYPRTFEHIATFRDELRQRDQSEIDIRYEWFCLSRPRPETAAFFRQPKIVFPDIAVEPSFSWDEQGHAIENTAYLAAAPKWVLGILNSNPVFWFFRQISNTIRGGFLRFIRQYVEQIPIPQTNEEQQTAMLTIVDYLLWLNRQFQHRPGDKTARDGVMLSWWEQMLNGLAYELYFPEDLHAKGIQLFALTKASGLPTLEDLRESQRVSRIREEFERNYATEHPLRGALSSLRSLELVRVIEGES